MQCNELIRDNVSKTLEKRGFRAKVEILKAKQFKEKLFSLFFARFKQTLNTDKISELYINYADMSESLQTLMVATKTKINSEDLEKDRLIQWYKDSVPSKQRLEDARIDLLQKFDELLGLKTEAVRDQFKELWVAFNRVVCAHNISTTKLNEVCKEMNRKMGRYTQRMYLESFTKVKTSAYSI